jgi:hypothetical protein
MATPIVLLKVKNRKMFDFDVRERAGLPAETDRDLR